MSAGPPTVSRPTSLRPMTEAGTLVAAAIACSSGAPSEWSVRTASMRVRTLPARAPSARVRDAVAHGDGNLTEHVRPVSVAGSCHRVGHEGEAVGRGRENDAKNVLGDVHAICDHLDDDVRRRQRRSRDTRIAMTERRHRIEDVRHRADPAVERRVGDVGGCIGVPDRDRDPGGHEPVDQEVCAGKLGGKRHEGDGAGGEQALEKREIGVAAPFGLVHAKSPAREKGSLEVHAEDSRPTGLERGDATQGGDDVLLGRGDEGGEVGGDAGLEHCGTGALVAVSLRLQEVDSGEPVHLQVDEPRHGQPAPLPAWQADGDDPAVNDLDIAREALAVDERGFDAQSHFSSASLTTPPAAASFARAWSASMSAMSETIATFGSPPAASRARSASASVTFAARRTMRRTRARSLSLVATTSTIRFPKVLPSRIIAIVEIMLSTSFCAVPALSRVDPAITSGPTTTASSCSASAPRSEPCDRDERDGQRTRLLGRVAAPPSRTAFARSR